MTQPFEQPGSAPADVDRTTDEGPGAAVAGAAPSGPRYVLGE